jgi:hypothetical protein
MTQLSKLESYKQHMAAAGVSKFAAFPPLWRILWRFGIKIPPPVFLGFLPNALIFGGFFGLFFGFGTWLLHSLGVIDSPALSAPWLASVVGVPFGLAMAYEQRTLASKHNLGAWSEFSAGVRT